MKKLFWIFVTMAAVMLIAGCGGGAAKSENLKAGYVYVGPVEDAGWTTAHDEGRKAMEELDFVDESTFVETVPEGAEATRVITELVESGCNMIFTTSFGYMDPTIEVASKYPDVKFHHCSGYKTAENSTNYFGRMYQTKYMAGVVAGTMSKSGKLGYVAPFPIPEIVRHINAFTLGAQSVNPDATVMVIWTNSWFDPVHEKEAANTMIAAGCDLITQGTDSAGPQEAAEAAGIYSIGNDSDMSFMAPTAQLTSAIWNWGVYYKDIATKINEGTWTNDPIWWGLDTGITSLSKFNEVVPQELIDNLAVIKAGIIEKDEIFTGPLYSNTGELKVAEGTELNDGEKLSIQWFVKGVKGKIPEAQ